MRDKRKTYVGWSMGLASFLAIATALPAIAGKAAGQKEFNVWQVKAERFQTAMTHDLVPDNMAEFTKSAAARDYADLSTQSPVTKAHLSHARFKAREQKCLAEAIYYEARSESRAGQLAVAEVVQNRVTSKHFPNSICNVVYEGSARNTGCQFSFTCDGSMDIRPRGKAWQRANDMARVSLIGGFAPLTNGATHYHTVDVRPIWRTELKHTKQIGTHKFYSFRFRERPVPSASISIAPPI